MKAKHDMFAHFGMKASLFRFTFKVVLLVNERLHQLCKEISFTIICFLNLNIYPALLTANDCHF